nr:hypothetical protein [Tanacetum cinerariifolium]
MTSFGYRLNPHFAIKECSSCGALYTRDFCCSKGSVEDKILVPKPPKNCARCVKCGHPVNGSYCQGCALLREKLEEDLVSYFQDFQNTSESSDDSTNVVNAPREPFVVKQDHGVNPLHIDKCCCECGNALNRIFCQQCICKSCGKGAHIGYNCPPKVSIISNPEPCSQTKNNELPQTLPSFDATCYSDKENSVPCVSKPNFVDESSNISNPPPQPPIYYCEFCGSDAQCHHYCTPQVPFICSEPGFDQTQPPQFFVIHPPPQEMSIKILHDHENVINSVQTFLRKFNRYSFFETPKVLLLAWDRIFEINDALGTKQYKPEDLQELFRELSNDVQNIHEELAEYINTPGWNRHAFYDDDDDVDYAIAITPVLSTEEPIDSLSMGNEHLDTIPATRLNEVKKSSVENLVPIPSESEGIPEHICDVPFHDNSPPLDVLKDQFEDFSESNDEFSSTDNDSFSIDNIDYDEASPPDSELEFADELSHIISPPEYDCFYFRDLLDPGELMSVLNSGIRENPPSTTRVNLPVEDDYSPLLTYVVWILLAYLTYLVIPPYLHPFRNEDTIFDPGITINHFCSFKPGLSHRCGAFKKFNTHRIHLNESPMIINGKNITILDVHMFHLYPP